jgi:F-type H+-transporting ATPase subunit gamma
VITSDRGLAGGYSANALKAANELADKLSGEGKEVVRYVIGRKGVAFYNFRRIPVAASWTGFSEQPSFADIRDATELFEFALTATSEGDVTRGEETTKGLDELYIVSTQFKNSVSQVAVAEQLSPVKSVAEVEQPAEEAEGITVSYEFEPDAKELIAALLPRYISARIFSALLESAASESAARRRAMKSASDNATELIRTYTRLANQARQAEITQEISEIVGGADALAAAGSDE